MKKLVLAIVSTLMLAGSLFAGTNPILATNTVQTIIADEGSFLSPLCAPRDLCDKTQFVLPPRESSPLAVCNAGRICRNDNLQLRAGDGSPMPVCDPGKHCNNDNLQLRAGDGSPMPVCDPGMYCNNEKMTITMVV